MEDPSNVRYY